MSYQVLISEEVEQFLKDQDDKTERIVKNQLRNLEKHPYPGKGKGDKEKLPIKGKTRYRLHIGRTWTAYYTIKKENKEVKVLDILPIDKAHKEYGH